MSTGCVDPWHAGTGKSVVIEGDARQLPLPDESVDLIVTSPPYYGLRSYTDGGEHYEGQIGDEPTPAAYIDNLITCTREWIRVLKPTGSIWVNLGDTYASNGGASGRLASTGLGSPGRANQPRPEAINPDVHARWRRNWGVARKSLVGLPWRYALACIDLGLILRAEVVWSKPNGIPESVTDRVRRSHETWFHLVKQPRYYSAVDEIRLPHARTWKVGGGNGGRPLHTGWRKGVDSLAAVQIHQAISKLPPEEWRAYRRWVVWALGEIGFRLCQQRPASGFVHPTLHVNQDAKCGWCERDLTECGGSCRDKDLRRIRRGHWPLHLGTGDEPGDPVL